MKLKKIIEIIIALVSAAILKCFSAYIYSILYDIIEITGFVCPKSGPFAYGNFIKLLYCIVCTIIILLISEFLFKKFKVFSIAFFIVGFLLIVCYIPY